ncbi:hypothetical protein [Caloranaerobacter azorensis]|uniref:hypothetical protein n=1 Tax=Caloranaerobacter azorensis TaxID=116090 RepID=UPI0012E00D4E|nr:hypothetical protein [Caloranaerobacter azorensis]
MKLYKNYYYIRNILSDEKAQQNYKTGGGNRWLKKKLCNPIKVESDLKLCKLKNMVG